ncbi:MAG: ASKHA domain-containing protein, partial [Desulfohalobium sp.]
RFREALARQVQGWQSACLVGNPVMLGILAGWDLTPLARPPYALPSQSNQVDLGPGLPQVYVPPLLGGFVGADVSGGLCALFEHEKTLQFPLLYADLGTNAEFVLAVDPERWYAASVPLGPALEGVGLRCGTVYSEKAWTGFDVGPQGLSGHPVHVQPVGITGSGVLSLLAHLRRANVLNAAGQWQGGQTPLERRIARSWETRRGEPCFRLSQKLTLSASDVEEVLKVKAIFTFGLHRLFCQAGLDTAACRQVHLAGNVSRYVQPSDLIELGFLPRMWQSRVHLRGNLALEGAMLLAQKRGLRDWIAARAATTRLEELAGAASATNGFVQHMHFAFAPRGIPG